MRPCSSAWEDNLGETFESKGMAEALNRLRSLIPRLEVHLSPSLAWRMELTMRKASDRSLFAMDKRTACEAAREIWAGVRDCEEGFEVGMEGVGESEGEVDGFRSNEVESALKPHEKVDCKALP